MANNEVHTVPTDGGWANELPGGEVLSSHENKDDAVAAGREQAIERQAEHVIHNADGTIAEKNSYGNDPRRTEG